MSCCTNSDHVTVVCDPANEPLSSALNNFITEFFGTLSKSCVNGVVVWTLPCDLTNSNPSFPRNAGEGLACYFNRFITSFLAAQVVSIGNKGYRTTALSASDVVLYRNLDLINQDFTGTLAAPVSIFLSSNGATNGDEFYLSFTGLVITATNTLTIRSDAVAILTLNTAGTVNGYLKAVYTGTAWTLTTTIVNIT